jgi:hypothetical protein
MAKLPLHCHPQLGPLIMRRTSNYIGLNVIRELLYLGLCFNSALWAPPVWTPAHQDDMAGPSYSRGSSFRCANSTFRGRRFLDRRTVCRRFGRARRADLIADALLPAGALRG